MRFWDSSAVVPLLVEETATRWVLGLYREDPQVLAWWGTDIECVSALARLERSGALSSTVTSESLSRLKALKAGWQEVQAVEAVRETAIRLLRVHELRAADSLQLAAAIIASQHRPSALAFVCLDERLKAAARREGFLVPEPGTPVRGLGSE